MESVAILNKFRSLGINGGIIDLCRDSSLLEQISWMSEADFNNLFQIEEKNLAERKDKILAKIQSEFAIDTSIKPYSYVKSIQENFNHSSIPYSDLFYELTGLER